MMAPGADRSKTMKDMPFVRHFVFLHELTHVESRTGIDRSDPRVVDIVDVMAGTRKLYRERAAADTASGRKSYAPLISERMSNVIESKSDMEEVIADLFALRELWQATKDKFNEKAKLLFPLVIDSVLRCIGASSLLGIYDNILGHTNLEIITELSGRYRDVCFARFEFLLGYA